MYSFAIGFGFIDTYDITITVSGSTVARTVPGFDVPLFMIMIVGTVLLVMIRQKRRWKVQN